jgi:hypothetical protein
MRGQNLLRYLSHVLRFAGLVLRSLMFFRSKLGLRRLSVWRIAIQWRGEGCENSARLPATTFALLRGFEMVVGREMFTVRGTIRTDTCVHSTLKA